MPKFILTITEYNTYRTAVEADDEQAAIAKAQARWDAEGPDGLEWDKGGLDRWHCYSAK